MERRYSLPDLFRTWSRLGPDLGVCREVSGLKAGRSMSADAPGRRCASDKFQPKLVLRLPDNGASSMDVALRGQQKIELLRNFHVQLNLDPDAGFGNVAQTAFDSRMLRPERDPATPVQRRTARTGYPGWPWASFQIAMLPCLLGQGA
jgi:hypothetical protein